MSERHNFKKQSRLFILTGIITALAFVAMIAVVSNMTRQMAKEEAFGRARELAYHYGQDLGSKIADALSIARTLARTLEAGMRVRERIDREVYDRFFVEVVEKSDDFFFGAWAVFEPGKFDGRDLEFSNKPGYGKNGDYIPFAYRKSGKIVFKHDVYEDDKDSAYYTIPKNTKQECVIDPYIDPDAENVVMSSVAVPVFDGGQVVGVAGIDILLSSLNRAISQIRPAGNGYVFLTGNNGFIVGHSQGDLVGKNLSDIGVSGAVVEAVKAGRETEEEKKDFITGEPVHFVYVPIKIGLAPAMWSLCVAIPMKNIMLKPNSITYLTIMVGVASMTLLAAILLWLARSVIVPLRRSEENLRRAFDHVYDAIIIHTEKGDILDVNVQMLVLYQISREELPKYSLLRELSSSANHFDRLPRIWKKVMAGEQQYMSWKARRPKTGTEFNVEIFLNRMQLFERYVIVATIRDVTRRQRMEAELLKTTKLESLGTLAGGIAHNFNNFLTGIMGNLMLAKKQAAPNDKLYEILVRAEKVAYKAKSLSDQLITFSKGGMPIKTLSSVNDLLVSTVRFVLTGSAVNIRFKLPDNLWHAEIDENQISQVITNIVLNARQAMKNDCGSIEIDTENVEIDTENFEFPGVAALPTTPGKYVKISIKDDGCGISQENIHKIFDPYFSTKPQGSGLGLSTSYSIIKNHGGFLKVESAIDSGSVFNLYLPASVKVLVAEEKNGSVEFKGKGRRVLLMDDDEMVLLPICEILTELEYEVKVTKEGREAIDAYKKSIETGLNFDVAILDLVVCNGIGGLETIESLLKLNKDIKVIVSSGYSNDPVMAEFKKYGFCARLAKPYNKDELSKVLYEVINIPAKFD